MFRNLQNGAFDSFDPDNYDPNNASGDTGAAGSVLQAAKPGQKMQVNLTLNNPTAVNLTLEMFSFLDSCTRRLKPEYAVGNYKFIPLLSYEGLAAFAALTDGTVGWDQHGNLAVHGDGSPLDPIATIGCGEIAYRAFFEASGIIPFEVAYIRFTCQTDDQIDENIIYFKKTFSGGITENTISPRAYFRPNQFQNRTIDITVNFTIGIDRGLRMKVLDGESVRLALFIQMWTNQVLDAA